MSNERGPRKTGRTTATGFKRKPTSTDSKRPTGAKKYSKDKKEFGDKKFFKKPVGAKNEESTSDKKWEKSFSPKGPYKKRHDDKDGADKGERKPYAKKPFGDKKSFSSKTPYKKKDGTDGDFSQKTDKKPFSKKSFREKDFSKEKKDFGAKAPYKKKFDDGKEGFENKEGKSFGEKSFTKKSGSYADYKKKGNDPKFEERKEYRKKTGIKTYADKKDPDKTYTKETEIVRNKDASKSFKKIKVYNNEAKENDGLIRLNKFIANAGICSRREADTFIQTGVVTVNGVIITELGYKVKIDDHIMFGEKTIKGEKPVYIILNKPKDYITTSKDPQNRKTVLDLINGVKERVFPIGRLDRNTTGVLLLTNDGPLAEKLMHPRKGVIKIYHAELNKKFTAPDLEQIIKGIDLEDGFFKPDEVDYVEGMDKHHVGIKIHSGANHIVRRLFEAMDYDVIKLDRVVYAGLTKKGLTRGKWRFLKDAELNMLKMM